MQRGLVEALPGKPLRVLAGPGVLAPDPVMAQQELTQPVPGTGAVGHQVRPRPAQIAYRLLGLGRYPDRDQLPGPMQPGQPPAVPPIFSEHKMFRFARIVI